MTTVYLFDEVTNEFKSTYVAQESPLEPGEYIIPVHATTLPPPTTAANEVAVFTNGAWSKIPNFKGQWIYNQTTDEVKMVDEIGAIQQGWALTPSNNKIKADVWSAIKAKRSFLQSNGVKVGTNWFDSNADSRIQQLGLVMMGATIPDNLQWKTKTNTFVTMTQTLANQIFAATAANDQAIFAVAESHKAAMEASNDPANYDFSAGWPETYAG